MNLNRDWLSFFAFLRAVTGHDWNELERTYERGPAT
jgi:hypothetical protein